MNNLYRSHIPNMRHCSFGLTRKTRGERDKEK